MKNVILFYIFYVIWHIFHILLSCFCFVVEVSFLTANLVKCQSLVNYVIQDILSYNKTDVILFIFYHYPAQI